MAQPAPAPTLDVFDLMPDPVALLAPDGSLLRANPAFRKAFRHWIGPQRPPWGRVQPPPFSNGERCFDAPAPDGRDFEWVERMLADGSRLAVARDVTRHAVAADHAMRAKTTLFATLTHELRTPLHGVLGMAGLLEQSDLEPSARAHVEAIKQSGEHLLDLITEILDYSRLEAGAVMLEAAPFDPEAAMQDVAELLSPRAHAKGLDLAVIVRADTPEQVLGDDGRLRQILFNLAGNAVKFTERGGVLLEVASRPGERVRFTVRDTGPGVPPDKQSLIFEEFTQADANIARRHGGTGLGLAVVRKLAAAMGGEAGLSSRPGQGAAFWVELPMPTSRPPAPPIAALARLRVAVHSRSHILAQALRTTLVSQGCDLVERDAKPDITLFEWRDEIPGAELMALKQEAAALIAVAPQERRDAIERCRAAGVHHYVLKPVRRRSLVRRLLAARAGALVADDAEPAQALRGLRVLLAEDNRINALLARTVLSRAGCLVTTVFDGEEAVAAANTSAYDLILLDIRMPRLDGLEAAQRIRAGGASARAPIVALTADGESERARALSAGMNDFITKPIDATRLLAVAERFTGARKAATLGPT
ncbi:MAG: response regulator [Hyphomonadaceae bacterium]|nr:response regulator [Hyphomonadaceae bacterium]